MSVKKITITLFQGVCIGIGNIIPGVSGGTIALILGIYQRLITALTHINLRTGKALLLACTGKKEHRQAFYETLRAMDALFLLLLGSGTLASIFGLSFLFTYLLKNFHAATYSFFAGLIFVSIVVPYKMMTRRAWRDLFPALLAIALVVGISVVKDQREERAALTLQKKLASDDGQLATKELKRQSAAKLLSSMSGQPKQLASDASSLLLYFGAAIVAISAMILPGISGSFLLLLMGLYYPILTAIKTFNLPVLLVFAAGCAVGLIGFTRLLDYIMKRHYNPTLAFLTGLIIGSLYGIWPFKHTITVGSYPFYGHNIFPAINDHFFVCSATFIVGGLLVLALSWYGEKLARDETGADVDHLPNRNPLSKVT